MRICLNLDPSRLLRWHLWVAEALATRPGNEVFCRYAAVRHPIPVACRLLFDVERMIYDSRAGEAVVPMEAALRALPARADGPADLAIDFAGEQQALPAGRVLTPLFNGVAGEIGVIAALNQGQDIIIELHDSAYPQRAWIARPASADRAITSLTLDGALSCAVELILKAVSDGAAQSPGQSEPGVSRPFAISAATVARASAMVAWKAAKLLDRLTTGGNIWGIGWRFTGSASLIEGGDAPFRMLASDPRSYVADPFPFRHHGRDYIFLELYPYATNKGCIAVVEVGQHGVIGEPRIVLEEPHHLSYPFVFERDGRILMLPEGGASGNVDLYEAVEFPWRWERVARLAEGIEIYDTTPLEREDGIWFFGSLRSHRSSTWDILGLYHAGGLTGAWTPHAGNPVLIDATLSRPAGAFIRVGDHTLRPVQNGGRSYGGGLTFCRLDALTETTFEQTPIGRICSGRFGCHTYNRSAGLEVIDLFGRLTGRQQVSASYWPISSKKSSPADERNFSETPMRFARRDARENAFHKNDHGPSYRP
jgi:hypothetical protein